MEYREKIKREKQMIDSWEEMETSKQQLSQLLLNQRQLGPQDFILFFQCMILVVENVEIHKEEIEDSPDRLEVENTDEKFYNIFGPLSENVEKLCGKEIIGEIEYFLMSMDDSKTINERFDAIEKIRMSAWKNMSNKKDEIVELLERYPKDICADDFMLIFKCISMILLELDMKNQERQMLKKLKFE
jgi:hypothetical protein